MMLTKRKTLTFGLVVGMIAFGGGVFDRHLARAKAEPYAVAQMTEKEAQSGPTTVLLKNAKIVIEPGAKFRLFPVKTGKGAQVRLEADGITVEVPRLTIESEGTIQQIEATAAGDAFTVTIQKASAIVGQIIVVGNTKTPDSTIRQKIPFFPGDVLDYAALRTAEKNLAEFGATVSVLDSPSTFKDILIKVKE